MSKMAEHLIEEQEAGHSLPLIPSTSEHREEQPEHCKEQKPSGNVVYWQLCLKVINAAGELAAKDKLLMNFRDPNNSHKVKHVIEQSYNGNVNGLRESRVDWIWEFFRAVDEVNWFSRKHGLAQVSAMKLMGMLEDANTRKKFRNFIRKHMETDHPAFELDELPARDFRTSRSTNGRG